MKKTTKSNEDYLEAILKLEGNSKNIKSVKVASLLGVTKAAVSIAMGDLVERGLVSKVNYGDIVLTDKGRIIATQVNAKHELIKKILLAIGVSEENADIECCKMEHILSEETINCLKDVCIKYNI